MRMLKLLDGDPALVQGVGARIVAFQEGDPHLQRVEAVMKLEAVDKGLEVEALNAQRQGR